MVCSLSALGGCSEPGSLPLLADVAGVHKALGLLAKALQLHKAAELQHIADAAAVYAIQLRLLRQRRTRWPISCRMAVWAASLPVPAAAWDFAQHGLAQY